MFQKFRLNRIKFLILILLFIGFIPNIKAIVKPTSDFYINDYANILSNETEEYILNKSLALDKVDGTQVVVVTVKSLEGMSIENYATKLFRNFGIGDSEKDNGLLLLLALDERQFRVEVGYGLEGILPDGKTGRFQDEYIIPYLKNDNWDEGIKNGYDAFYKEIVTLNNLSIDYSEPVESNDVTSYFEVPTFSTFLGALLGIVFGTSIKSFENKSKKNDTIIYFIVWLGLFIVSILYIHSLIFFLIINLMFFISARFGKGTSSGGFSSHSGSSRGGFSGRGGSSGGGGSSRGF